ncbi:hypothetical protein EB118_23275 [bacterium]|nr:hypothetical protein [bacterium]
MKHCWPKKMYYVALNKPHTFPDGGWRDFISTPSLGRARYYAKKLKRKYRQIDVYEKGNEPYVLFGSWL